MAENKKSVLLYCDIIHTVEQLDDVDAGILFKHFLRYINDQNPEPPSKLIQIVFEPIKQNLKRDLKKWEAKSLKNKENANKRWNANASERIESDANHADKDKDKVIVKDKVKDKDIIYPLQDEFVSFALANKPTLDTQAVINKFLAWSGNSWVNGNGKKIKNWKSTLLNTIPFLPEAKGQQSTRVVSKAKDLG